MNSKRKCTGCKDRFSASEMISLPAGYFHSTQCAIEYAAKRTERARERQKKQTEANTRKEIKSRKEALKSKSQWMREAQSAVNKYIRIRDRDLGCISCGSHPEAKRGGSMDAGHYRSRGSAGHLRYNTFNIHAQCVRCNRYLSSNAVDYRIGLIKRIGIDRVIRLEQDWSSRKFTIEYLERIKRIFNKRSRHLAKLRGYDV